MKNLPLTAAQSLLEHCPVAMLLVAEDGTLHDFNQAFARLLDVTTGLKGTVPADGMLTPLLGPGTLVNWIMPDGDVRWLAVETLALEANPAITARFYQDVTEKLRLRQERDVLRDKLSADALRDGQLTSLLSRLGMKVSLEPMVSRCRRYNSSLSIIALGIEVAEARDQALTAVVALLQDQTRWADIIGCNSNHDFILILQETTQDSALQLVEKLAAEIERINTSADWPLTASYGITQCRQNDDTDSLLERAEAALAEAQRDASKTSIAV